MDVVGSADPYFIAKLDDKISFVSTVKENTVEPVWNEKWLIKNVPKHAELIIEVFDKDNGAHDDFIGRAKISIDPGTKEVELESGLLKRKVGTFWFKLESSPPTFPQPASLPYLFDGPIRFSRHCSPTVGFLTNLNEQRLYTTWKMYLRGISMFFGSMHQHWNVNYKAAQQIFQGPTSFAVRSGIQAGHRMLYARSTTNGFGIIDSKNDIREVLKGGGTSTVGENDNIIQLTAHRVKPAVYTYIISSEDDSFRFSETGAAFFVDFASKHALHSNCCETVRYSGEFHPRPKGGWGGFHDDIQDTDIDWELVIDNNSGTYAPDKQLLPQLKEFLEYNFPGFTIYALDREDPMLQQSVKDCREYALRYRAVSQQELQPTTHHSGEVTLSASASVTANSVAASS
ncbi:hypothetical protein DL96DRAFT_1584066 [Flagelloscypha sp. PMI_526]|nr:hypothetical protein DL96DRAFT_1584066 [Flagelloscypha sp. PMI_526]